jgi:hypothetical protein
MTADIKDFYLGTPLTRPEYVRITLKHLPARFVDDHHLGPFVHNGSVLFEINKGMYGLPQAGLLAQQRLQTHLATHGYHVCPTVPCLYLHETRSIAFTLVVDEFAIKYQRQEDADHLLATLRTLYAITVDKEGSEYLGIKIRFDAAKRSVTLSMPTHVTKALQRFGSHIKHGAASPMVYVPPVYGAPIQAPAPVAAALSPDETLLLQQIVGSFLWYARVIDCTMLPAVNAIGSELADGTIVNFTPYELNEMRRIFELFDSDRSGSRLCSRRCQWGSGCQQGAIPQLPADGRGRVVRAYAPRPRRVHFAFDCR